MAKYIGKDGIKKGKLGKELYYYAFQSNLVRELPVDSPSPNTTKNIMTKAKFGSVMKLTEYCFDESLLGFFPDIKGAKMKNSAIVKQNKKNFLPMPKEYYKQSSLLPFGDFSLPGNIETGLRTDIVNDTILGEDVLVQGLLVAFECFHRIQPTVKEVSEWFLDTYPVFKQGDYIHVYAMMCENCFYRNSDSHPIDIQGRCRKKYIHRVLKIDKNNNTRLSYFGLALAQENVGVLQDAYKIVLIPLYNEFKLFRSNIVFHQNPGVCYYWVADGPNSIHPWGGSVSVENTPYHSIKEKLKTEASKKEILKSWKVTDYPLVNDY